MQVQESLLKTGVPGFERLLAGLPMQASVLVSGPPGAGKSLFSKQFLMEGLRNGQPAVLVSTTENRGMALDEFERLGFGDARAFAQKGLLQFVDVYSWVLRERVEEEGVAFCNSPADLNDISLALRAAADQARAPVRRLAFDSLTSLFFHNRPESILRFLEVVHGRLNAEGFTSLFLLTTGTQPPDVVSSLEYLTDGTVAFEREGDDAFVRVPRMKGVSPARGRNAYEIMGTGISVRE